MVRVVGIDHLVIRVSDYERPKAFYGRLFAFLGFEVSDEYPDAIGWTNGKTRFWIGPADAAGRRHRHRAGDVGFHHYAFQLRSRKDVDALQAFLAEDLGATIVDPAGEHYDDDYAVFFLDPDGLKLEGMRYGERQARGARRPAPRGQGPGRLLSLMPQWTAALPNLPTEGDAEALGREENHCSITQRGRTRCRSRRGTSSS